jgi:predicted transposase YbfD/YdcC
MMSIEGAVVTIDAMGCQRNVAAKIIEKKADYILALKAIREPCRGCRGLRR